MDKKNMERIFIDTDYVHWSGTEEEKKVADYLKDEVIKLGLKAEIESFKVNSAKIEEAVLLCDGKEVDCKALFNCGSGEVEGELYYMPSTDPVSIAGAKDKIVLMDQGGIGFFQYQDLMKAGAKGIIFQSGELYHPNDDIDERDLRAAAVGEERKVLCVMINTRTAREIVKNRVKNVKISIKQEEWEGESHNVVVTIPGVREDYIALSAHYDSTSLSHGAYDNMSGCVGLLGVMDNLKDKKLNYGLKFIFCGSEERGLLGSKAYVSDHEKELENIALNINLDMIGSILGKFIAVASCEDKLPHYIEYMGAELGFPVNAKTGVYSSDSTPFADKGVPSVSLARITPYNADPIHCRYDLLENLSMEQLEADIDFITEFTKRMANSMFCPVSREIPEDIKEELDKYLFRKRSK